MPLITPTQLAALTSAARDSAGQLRRTRGPRGAGYRSDSDTAQLHSPVSVCALERDGLLTEHAPGFQAVYVITEAGRRVVEANLRVGARLQAGQVMG
jgi:hypothetical protein